MLRGQHHARGVERDHRARAARPARHRHDLPASRRCSRPRRSRSTTRRTAGSSSSYGAAWFDKEHTELGIPFPPLKERVDAFEEAVQIVRGLLTTDDFTFEGKHFQVQDATLLPAPGAAAAPADLDRRVGREAHDADRGALRRRVALLRAARVPRRRSRQRLSAHAEAAGPRPGRDHGGRRRCRSRTTSTASRASSTSGRPPASSTSCAAGRGPRARRAVRAGSSLKLGCDHRCGYDLGPRSPVRIDDRASDLRLLRTSGTPP